MSFRAQLHLSERRRSDRAPAHDAGLVDTGDGGAIEVVVRDLSQHGFRAEGDHDFDIGAAVALRLAGPNPFAARVVWREGRAFGCEFIRPISAVAVADAFSGRLVIE